MVLQSFTAETDVLESYTDKAEKLYNNLGMSICMFMNLSVYYVTVLIY